MKYLLIFTTLLFAGELEVDGNLKVTGTVDAQGNPITNVGSPLLSTDAANAGYVLNTAAGKGRIITLECPWVTYGDYNTVSTSSCEPPTCPNGWNELTISNNISGISDVHNVHPKVVIVGNSVRFCIEQEDEE